MASLKTFLNRCTKGPEPEAPANNDMESLLREKFIYGGAAWAQVGEEEIQKIQSRKVRESSGIDSQCAAHPLWCDGDFGGGWMGREKGVRHQKMERSLRGLGPGSLTLFSMGYTRYVRRILGFLDPLPLAQQIHATSLTPVDY